MLKGLIEEDQTLNNKMAIHIYQQLNLKNKISKQEQKQNHRWRTL